MIRLANNSDIPAIMKIVKDSIKIMEKEGNDQWDANYPLEVHYEKDIKEGHLYVFEEGKEVLGVACISDYGHHEYDEINWLYEGKYYCVKRLAVAPKARGRGIALQLYLHAEKVAKKNGVHLIRTDTYSKNLGARYLFEKAKYQYVEERKDERDDASFYYFEKKF